MDSLSRIPGLVEPVIAPARPSERILSIDVIRGFALLGILLMNIQLFAFPHEGYADPHVAGGNDPVNRLFLMGMFIFGEGKMRALFSMVFGASAMIFLERTQNLGAGIRGADLYFCRMLWLMMFGTIHAYAIWWGDILYTFALFGLVLFVFRCMSSRGLILTAFILSLILFSGYVVRSKEAWSAIQIKTESLILERNQQPLSDLQRQESESAERIYVRYQVSEENIRRQVDAYQGNYGENLRMRMKQAWEAQRSTLYFPQGWDMFAMMLVGMALYRSGILSGDRSKAFYVKHAAIWGITGLSINMFAMKMFHDLDFQPIAAIVIRPAVDAGRITMMLGYASFLILLVKSNHALWVTARLADVGRMAFSNYIVQSLVCSVIFYGGYGLGLFNQLERWQMVPIVIGIWVVNLVWSSLWLRFFQFGPLEWLLRSLTYWRKQPMRSIGTFPEPEPIAKLQ